MSEVLVPLMPLGELDDGEMKTVLPPDFEPVTVYRQGEDYFVTQESCTHARAVLAEGWLEGYEVICPVHEARFDIRDGRALCFPAKEPLRTFNVIVRDGFVHLDARPSKAVSDSESRS